MINFEDILRRADDDIFCIENGRKYTFYELKQEVANLMYFYMNKYNVTELKRVVYVAQNSYKLLAHLITLTKLNVAHVGINYTFDDDKITKMITESESQLVLTDTNKFGNIKVDVLNIETVQGVKASLDLLKINGYPKTNAASLLYTSGTSGMPKMIIKTNTNFEKRRQNINEVLKLDNSKKFRYLITMPLFHASCKGWIRYFSLFNTTFVISRELDAVAIEKAIEENDVNAMLITPNKLKELSISKKFECIIVGGAHFASNVKIDTVRQFGSNVYEYYGTSETGVNSLMRIDEYNKSIIKPLPGVDFLLVDNKLAISSYELFDTYKNIKPKFVYHNNKKYFVTNDNAVITEDGYYIVSRGDYVKNCCVDYNMIGDLLCSISFIHDIKFEENNDVKIVYIATEYKYCRLIKDFVRVVLGDEWKINISPYIIYSLTGKC